MWLVNFRIAPYKFFCKIKPWYAIQVFVLDNKAEVKRWTLVPSLINLVSALTAFATIRLTWMFSLSNLCERKHFMIKYVFQCFQVYLIFFIQYNKPNVLTSPPTIIFLIAYFSSRCDIFLKLQRFFACNFCQWNWLFNLLLYITTQMYPNLT